MPEHTGRVLKKKLKIFLNDIIFMRILIVGIIVSAPRHRNPTAACSPAGKTITGNFSIGSAI